MHALAHHFVHQLSLSCGRSINSSAQQVVTQFKVSLVGLTEILMSKEPWYVRCIKPNESKQPVCSSSSNPGLPPTGRFDDVLVRHQVKYLGLMEHLRVRRAGFAYRRKFEIFLQRYKALCPETWPNWRGSAGEGVRRLVRHLGYTPDDYKMGRTKIFIRHPRTLFATEDAFQLCKHKLATRIQAKYKGYRVKGNYIKQREAATKIETCWRGLMARKEKDKRQWAVKVIKKFIKGFMTRHDAAGADNSEYLTYVRQSYLTRLKDSLPLSLMEREAWLTPPPIMQEASQLLKRLYTRHMVRLYVRGITPQRKAQMLLKLQSSNIFKGKKENYPFSVCVPFCNTRIAEEDISLKVLQMIRPERVQYSVPVVKYDRNGFRPRLRQLLFTLEAAYLLEEAKVKQRIDFTSLKGVSVSNFKRQLPDPTRHI
uniref:Uncharacterized protein n=1 Tax=Knipowitschia caucasica TaxID=637954 RepID=A0AAV2IWL8_KNICA